MVLPVPSPDDGKMVIEAGRRISQLWKLISGILRQNKSRVLLTGMQGVGKTVLFDYLTGKAYKPNYRPPTESSKSLDSGRLREAKRVGLHVMPGQDSQPRIDAALETILGKAPPDGIVHVLANGFATTRGDGSSDVVREMAKLKTVGQYQKIQRKYEYSELDEVCRWIGQAHRKARKPAWVILAVTKYDLFPNELSLVHDEYFPGGRGGAVKRMEELTRSVGSVNFRWQSATVCSWLEPFVWKSESVPSQFTTAQRDTLVEELGKLILGLCQGGRDT